MKKEYPQPSNSHIDWQEKWGHVVKDANNPLWDDEVSANTYIYPLHIDSTEAQTEGERLACIPPPEVVYKRGPFVCAKSPSTHIGPFKWADDFLVPDGTPVISAQDGVVVEVKEDGDTYGWGKEFRDYANFITLAHDHNEFTQYIHLAYHSVSVKAGDSVKQGDIIAIVGKTGWTDRDHLHFVVLREIKESPYGFKSVRPQFRDTKEE